MADAVAATATTLQHHPHSHLFAILLPSLSCCTEVTYIFCTCCVAPCNTHQFPEGVKVSGKSVESKTRTPGTHGIVQHRKMQFRLERYCGDALQQSPRRRNENRQGKSVASGGLYERKMNSISRAAQNQKYS